MKKWDRRREVREKDVIKVKRQMGFEFLGRSSVGESLFMVQ